MARLTAIVVALVLIGCATPPVPVKLAEELGELTARFLPSDDFTNVGFGSFRDEMLGAHDTRKACLAFQRGLDLDRPISCPHQNDVHGNVAYTYSLDVVMSCVVVPLGPDGQLVIYVLTCEVTDLLTTSRSVGLAARTAFLFEWGD